jgi:hypothetical protein
MKKAYQPREWKVIEQSRSHLADNPGAIPLMLPLAEIAPRLQPAAVGQFDVGAALRGRGARRTRRFN